MYFLGKEYLDVYDDDGVGCELGQVQEFGFFIKYWVVGDFCSVCLVVQMVYVAYCGNYYDCYQD